MILISAISIFLQLQSANAQTPNKVKPGNYGQHHANTLPVNNQAKPASTPVKNGKENASDHTDASTTDVIHVGNGASTTNGGHTKLALLDSTPAQVQKEEEEINKLLTANPSECEREELNLRKMDAEFLRTHKDQIQDTVDKVQNGLRAQRKLLRDYKNGQVEDAPFEKYINPEGKEDQSAMIVFNDKDTGKQVKIAVKDLLRYIEKFEAEAKKVGDDTASVDAFLAKYSDPATANDPAFFKMTLKQAQTAYACNGRVNGCLSSVFQVSYKQEQGRRLILGSGKTMFRVQTTTVMGFSPLTVNGKDVSYQVGSLSNVNARNMELNLTQNFGESFKQAEEGNYWAIIRAQALTIDGVPVDGYQRRLYYDQMRSRECQKGVGGKNAKVYVFNSSSTPGPFMDYNDKELCKLSGIQTMSASLTKTRTWNGSAAVGSVYIITDAIRAQADGRDSISSTFYDTVRSQGVGSCDDVLLKVDYTCGCEKTPRHFEKPYKIDYAITFGCD